MLSNTPGLELSINTNWLDCDIGTVTSGIEKSTNGQITRLFYESYGNPDDDPGYQDCCGDSEHRRMVTLRAIDSIPFASDKAPTLVFKDSDNNSFYLTPLNNIRNYPPLACAPDILHLQDMRESDKEMVLAVQDGHELIPIGVNVALAIPDHTRMSPQLASTKQ